MTLRGRLTVLALAAAGLGLLWRLASGLAPAPAFAPFPSSVRRSPTVVAAPARAEAPTVPEAVWSRLPPTAREGSWPEQDGPLRRSSLAGRQQDGQPIAETVKAPAGLEGVRSPLRVAYTVAPELTHRVLRVLRKGRVSLGHVIVLDPRNGHVLAYVATDPVRLPATRAYPAASLMKVVTAAAVLERAPAQADRPCRYLGNPYRITRARLQPPHRGRSVSFARALATSNNQCFARLAVHALGLDALLSQIGRLGLLEPPAAGHEPGRVDRVSDPLGLGRLGSGLAGCRITPLAAARLAAILAQGELVTPRWIARVLDASGQELELPASVAPARVLPAGILEELRGMLVETTRSGTARRAFRTRRGPLLGSIRVSGKTGSVTGRDPLGRYEWFIGVAPAERPRVAVATLIVQDDLWWISSAQLAAEVMKAVFCPAGVCREDAAARWTAASRG